MEKYKVETALLLLKRSDVFKDMRLEDLMRNLARWYDVQMSRILPRRGERYCIYW